MKNIIIKYIITGFVLLSMSACKDYLEQVNPNEMSTSTFWKTLDDCEHGLIAVYNAFKNQNVIQLISESKRADENYPGWRSRGISDEYYLQTFTESSDAPNNKWNAIYTGVFRANQVIKALESLESQYTSEADVQQWTNIMGQARFFRGLFYFYLYNSFNYGSVVIFDFVPETEEDFLQPLSPASTVRAFILDDLRYAYENLPVSESVKSGKATAGAAAAVLGKLYLYENDYETAALYFKDVIDNYGYTLANVWENMTTNGELNSESILEIEYSLLKPEVDLYSAEGTHNLLARDIACAQAGGWRVIYPLPWLIMEFKNDSIDINDARNVVGTDSIGDPIYRKYSLRTSYSIALVDDEDLLYYGVTCAQKALFNNLEPAYYRKNTNWDIVENEGALNYRSGINYRVIRLADVFLMYAECLIEGGENNAGVNEALLYINKVRQRSALQLIGSSGVGEFPSADYNEQSYTATTLMDHLMYKERPMELCAEGHAIRHLDLRRWGITKQRFQEIASMIWHCTNWTYIDINGEPQELKYTVLGEGYHPNGWVFAELTALVEPAINYIEQLHSYWPIPSGERTANPNLND